VKVTSPIGDYDYRVERIALRNGQLEVAGRLGEWETTMVIERSDFRNLLGKAVAVLGLASGLWAVTRWLRRV
jgi:hypothetical protein